MHCIIDKNEHGRDFVVGDIHGHFDLLMEELSYEGFDPKQDRVFSVGDLIDRGPASLNCLKLLDQPWFYAVRGNHEQMMIDWSTGASFPSWERNYGMWTRNMEPSDITEWVGRLQNIPIAMTIVMRVQNADCCVGICHAEPSGHNWTVMVNDPDCYQQMMWGRKVLRGDVDPKPVTGVDITVHGHTPVPRMQRIGNRFFIDTGAGDGDRLTVRKLSDLVQEYRDFTQFL